MTARLSPLGAVRVGHGLLPVGDPLADFDELRGVVGEEALTAAWELACLVPEGSGLRPAVLALAATLLWNDVRGSTLLPVGDAATGPLAEALGAVGVPQPLRERVQGLVASAGQGGAEVLFGRPGEYRPFIVDRGAVAIERRARLEKSLLHQLRMRLAAEPAPVPSGAAEALADVVSRPPTSGGQPLRLSAEQLHAVVASAFQRLTVVSGGPGTGKTSIIVSMLRLLARLGVDVAEVALAAPTGKAAHRMEEAAQRHLASVQSPGAADERLKTHGVSALTLHRLLGYSPRRATFQHHAQNPLSQQVVIIDEASMIDVSLMDQLVRAVAPEARLVLLGDAEQLPSVEAGAVLRDLVPVDMRRPPRAWDTLLPTPVGEVGEVQDLRHRGAIRLVHSHRMDEADPQGRAILEVSQAIRSGLVPEVSASLREGAHLVLRTAAAEVGFAGVELLDGADAERAAFLARWYTVRVAAQASFARLCTRPLRLDAHGRLEAAEVPEVARLDGLLQSARVLCLFRSGRDDAGVIHANQVLGSAHSAALPEELAEPGEELLPGTPLLMTQNDYALGLYNGDVGVVVRVQSPGDDVPDVRLAFASHGEYRLFERAGLAGRVEPAWAMTVHKAQGSEFDHVALLLPRAEALAALGGGQGLLSREVVYTSLTRARRSATVVGTLEVLRRAIGSSVARYSGLADPAVWRAGG